MIILNVSLRAHPMWHSYKLSPGWFETLMQVYRLNQISNCVKVFKKAVIEDMESSFKPE